MRIAIIGSGISGLACANLLDEQHEVTLFEADGRLGGHANTVTVEDPDAGPIGVDTGFIVHNDRNYPNLLRLFDRLGVQTQDSEMSFSVTDSTSGFTYRATNLSTLLARPSMVSDKRLWRMLYDIARFYRNGRRALDNPDPSVTIADFLDQGRYSDTFINLHLIPMGAAVWSTSPGDFTRFPATALLRFLQNHGLLGIGDRPQWRTVVGGSSRYVDAIVERFGGTIHYNRPVMAVRRCDVDGRRQVSITSRNGANGGGGRFTDHFDRVILACHSDQSLDLITDPSPAEKEVLDAIGYEPNLAVLHTDTSVLSPARRAWAAWNYHVGPNGPADHRGGGSVGENAAESRGPASNADGADGGPKATLTYDMTALQQLPGARRYLVTLNPQRELAGEIGRYHYAHPQFTVKAMAAQDRFEEIDGADGLHFCGAYWGYGFHEDGMSSAVRVCRKLGVDW